MTKKVEIYDTTLRDGEQGEGIAFTLQDKLKIAHLLDDIGVDYIEGGWPGSTPKADQFFAQLKKIGLKNAKLVAFGSTCRVNGDASKDKTLTALVASGAETITIFGKAWDLHVSAALKTTLAENLRIIKDSIEFLKKKRRQVFFDAEHFFDAYKNNPEYALKVLTTAEAAGCDRIILCDTNGGCLYSEVAAITAEIVKNFTTPIGIHTHNDSDQAVASSLAAVAAGASQVQGTINGYGERCGNANLCSIIPNLQLKMGKKALGDKQLQKLTELSHHVSEIANLPPNNHLPFVGHSAFAHKAGIHVSAIQKNALTYEHIAPEKVGNKQRVVISEQSGISNLIYKAAKMKVDLNKESPQVRELLATIKDMENNGYQFEEGEGSFDLLVRKALGKYKPLFDLVNFRVINERVVDGELMVEATVKIVVKGKMVHTVADGNGPVSALDRALRKALVADYPQINEISLSDYRVRVLDSKEGTKAKVRVIIESRDSKDSWGTVGVSTDIINASWSALVDSLEYRLAK